ncbi:MAG: pseudouridylate synthase [Tannerellaceae bacterium]|jgi:predicted hotdog family 3-hydroxylacyl-ACP dehydratase|nr:pseudouridylate synthase [Tannerellaceae bacterium]
MQFPDIDITDLLPQRRPFILIDRLLDFDKERTLTSLQVREDNLFCDDGCLSESGLIETIAQTCAARMGYINRYLCHDTVKLGLIGAIRHLEIRRLPRVGEVITTQVLLVEEVFRMTLVQATVRVGEEPIASCEMKISITDIERNA